MTTKIENEIKEVDQDKCARILEKLLADFNQEQLTDKEIVLVLSNTMYSLGAYIEGYKNKGPTLKVLEKQYYTQPTAGNGLMLQGLLMSTWLDTMPNTQPKVSIEKKQEEKIS